VVQNLSLKTKTLNKVRSFFRSNFIEVILRKLANGKRPDSFIGKILPPNYLYEKASWREIERNGISYLLDISDLVDWYIYFGIKDESHLILFSLCRSDSCVLDVGANNGAVMLQMANICRQGIVFGFEPDQWNFKRLQKNIERNNSSNYRVFNFGLGETEDHAVISTIDENNRGMNRIDAGAEHGHQVRITTIDHFARREMLLRLDLIKIDTEGYELKILKGAAEMLKCFRPTLFIEVDDNNLRFQGDSAQELVSYLVENFGYQLREALTGMPVTLSSSFDNCHFDIIAT
jgi:FkbM family methyltransferase